MLARKVRTLERIASLMQVVATAAAALVVFTFGEVVMTAFAAVLAALMLRGAAFWLGRITRLSTGWGLVVVIVLLAVSVGGLGWGFGPSLTHQVGSGLSDRPSRHAAHDFSRIPT